jgi:DnaJ family protein C protein 9
MSEEKPWTCSFSGLTFYQVLGISPHSNAAEIRAAYKKKAILVHPDKNKDPKAQQDFQILARIMEILGKPEEKEIYDTAPYPVSEKCFDASSSDDNTMANAKQTYESVTTHKIDCFAEKYRFSEQERFDVLMHFVECDGDLNEVLFRVMLSEERDKPRFKKWIEEAMAREEIPKLPIHETYVDKEIELSIACSSGLALPSDDIKNQLISLRDKEKKRQEQLIQSLTHKYGPKKKDKNDKKRKGEDEEKEMEEPSEEEFQRIQKRLMDNYNKKRKL